MKLKKQRNMSNKKEKKTKKKNKTIKKKIRKEKKGGIKSSVQTFAISERMMLDKEYNRKIWLDYGQQRSNQFKSEDVSCNESTKK